MTDRAKEAAKRVADAYGNCSIHEGEDKRWLNQGAQIIREAIDAETAELKQQLATATEQLQAVHSHVAEALQLLGVDISVDGYMPDSWTLREQCHLAKQQLAERDRQAQAWEQTALKVHAWITELHSSVKEVLSPTVMQWLGTNCGWAFLDSVLQKCGYQIVPAAGWKEGSRDG